MKKTIILFLHLSYWLLYFLLLALIFFIVGLQAGKSPTFNLWTTLPLIILCVLPNLLSFYLYYSLIFTRFLSRQKFVSAIIFSALVSLAAAIFAFVISLFLFGLNQPIFSNTAEFFPMLASFFLLATIHGGIALVIRGFVTWYDEIKLKEELAKKNYETEIALIKSQINPHFLFNTINNIDVLITKDSHKASDYLNKLSDILRYMVYETRSEKISLKTELDYIEKYLELQKIRTANPNYVNITIEGESINLQIAPMIFFPFIENAFKHTENDKKSNSIYVNFTFNENSVKFECKNTYQKISHQKQEYGGLGNELIRKRLNLLYPKKHLLEISESDGIYRVGLVLELNEN